MSTQPKRCSTCFLRQPIDEFRRRSRGGIERLNQCNQCHRDAERTRRQRGKLKSDSATLARFTARIKAESRPDRIAAIIEAAFDGFGGASKFVEAFVAYTTRLRADAPNSKRLCDVFLALLRLAEWRDVNQPKASELSDPELEKQKTLTIERAIRSSPELVVRAAAQIGWTVTPPDSRA
jgi:hypothetical protein